MYRILLKDSEMADLMNDTGNFVTTVSASAEGKLGYLLGRAEYLQGLPITAYVPNQIPVSVTEVDASTVTSTN